ncbi:hypothetical protein M409DRAFT_65538 [Zasmidium cellare ATCC 36951]|uniref:GIT Spa2 homology (SHD) domain-containing protein n=1 Tax=Zasmidium cellare ATCC 36951 TaxID=1080233 RepID=A0A6A6CNG5_ZASCE|nr:uncharacterized protein M409DRAFT_65538 [Zasmidium cellare ATCC 36951]KAF2168664.1 hypothetical protein M409DRAFT_65538 [Zasmidium cellare ATCC 36951]
MSRPAPPFSPLSMSSNDSSFVGRYETLGGTPGGTPNDAPYTGGPYGAARPAQASPPASQHPSSSTDMSRPSVGGSSVNGNRPPSSASSVGMSSDGRMGMGRPPPGDRDSSRSHFKDESEAALSRHYTALKSYLQVHLQDEKGNIKPNRARDKLLRLSVTQFMELSTDVYDELIRREDERMQRVENVPRFLLPKQNFHPKRNQARQKLSTLPIERFRQLATDVFYELERRIPRIIAGDMGRPRSTTSNASGRSRAPSRGGMRPPPGPGYGYPPGPPGPGRGRGYPPGPYGPGPGMPPGSRRPSEAGSLGRPLPKHLQSNTIVPNKGTMVEDDEMDDDEDAFGLDHVGTGLSARPSMSAEGSAEDKEKIQAQETELAELKEKLEAKEAAENEWTSLREELEQKHLDAQTLNENLQQELAAFQAKSRDEDEIREQHDHNIQALRDQLEDLHAENEDLRGQSSNAGDLKLLHAQLETHQAENEGLKRQLQNQATPAEFEQRIQELEAQLEKQQMISQQVQEQATTYLREMRDLSQQNDQAIEQEEKMAAKISQLEKENDQWRQRYAKVKAQNKSLRASTMGLGLQTGFDSGSLVRQEGLISEGGLVRDTDVTRFQLAVDELLKVARQTSTDAMLESVKSVAISVQSITSAVRTEGYPTPSPSPLSPETNMQQAPSVNKIKARVNGTANSLITATKQHAASHGLSPVALLDAAASNLTAAVVELVKAVHIRPSNKADFQDLDGVDELNSFYDDTTSPSTSTNPNGLQIPVPTFNAPVPPPAAESKAVDPATLPVRKASMKKPNGGWFGWAGKWNDDGAEAAPAAAAPPVTNGHPQQQHLDDSDGEYDPYR